MLQKFKELQNELFKEKLEKKNVNAFEIIKVLNFLEKEEDEREEISSSFQSIKEKDITNSYIDTRNMMLFARDGLRNVSNPLGNIKFKLFKNQFSPYISNKICFSKFNNFLIEATSEKLRGAEKIYSNYGSVIMTSQFYLKELKKK